MILLFLLNLETLLTFSLNSTLYPSIQFTIDDFNDNDIRFHSSGTSVYRKPMHTGQYQHISSFFHLGYENLLGFELS